MGRPARYTVAVDFDGVLHSYVTPWIDTATIPDPPVPGAIEWLNEIAKDFDVVIHTTRGDNLAGQVAVVEWLRKHGFGNGGEIKAVTNKKPMALVYIDDRAWRFVGRFPTAEEIHAARPWKVKKES